jgi:hypothetical protein
MNLFIHYVSAITSRVSTHKDVPVASVVLLQVLYYCECCPSASVVLPQVLCWLGRLSGHDANIEVISTSFLVRFPHSGGFVKAQSRPTSATTYRPVGGMLKMYLKLIFIEAIISCSNALKCVQMYHGDFCMTVRYSVLLCLTLHDSSDVMNWHDSV